MVSFSLCGQVVTPGLGSLTLSVAASSADAASSSWRADARRWLRACAVSFRAAAPRRRVVVAVSLIRLSASINSASSSFISWSRTSFSGRRDLVRVRAGGTPQAPVRQRMGQTPPAGNHDPAEFSNVTKGRMPAALRSSLSARARRPKRGWGKFGRRIPDRRAARRADAHPRVQRAATYFCHRSTRCRRDIQELKAAPGTVKLLGSSQALPLPLPAAAVQWARRLAERKNRPSFGGINLEDIKAPECFYIEERLREAMDIPVFHDDQHGTAIIVAAGMINAIHLTGRDMKTSRLVCNGAGAAGIACLDLIKAIGFEPANVMLCDTKGIVFRGRSEGMNQWKSAHAVDTPLRTLEEAMVGADIFFGLSAKGALTPNMVKAMAPNPIIFAMANPDPEITPEDAQKTRDDVIIATGRSDYPNQINNILGFPYIFRGALDVRAKTINMEMKIAAAHALADLAREDVPDEVAVAYQGAARPRFGRDYIVPVPFDPRLIYVVPIAVAKAAMASGVARRPIVDLVAYKAQLSARRDPIAGAMQRIVERVRRMPKRVVFAEGEEEQVIHAACSFVNQGLGAAILVGREERVRAAAEASGLDLSDKGIEIHNARLSQRNALYAQFLYERLQRKGYLLRDCQRLINQDRNSFGAAMVARGDADAMVTGVTRNFSIALQEVRRVIDDKPGHRVVGVLAHPLARPHNPGRRHRDHRNADRRGSRGHCDRIRRSGAAAGARTARRHARLLQLRPSARRAHPARAGGRQNSRLQASGFRI